MRCRIIDYVGNQGGGVRFVVEMLRQLRDSATLDADLVSHGAALERYRSLLPDRGIRFVDVAPANCVRTRAVFAGIPGAGPLNWFLGLPDFHFEVPAEAFGDCDVAWLPWLHRHRIPWRFANKVVASFHDAIIVDLRHLFPQRLVDNEEETIRQWLRSNARIAVSSNATVATLGRLFGASPDRFRVVPVSGQHLRPAPGPAPAARALSGTRYVHCPSNISPHKNTEVLFAGMGRWGAHVPLVLTGGALDLWAAWLDPNRARLRRAARRAGLVRDRTLFALGYVDDTTYYAILEGAWALVMPTLAEGGGSFPVLEAMHAGVPVICSDIPVLREMVERWNGAVLWFEPRSPEDLTRALSALETDYARFKALAVERSGKLRPRTWAQVANEYADLMRGGFSS